MELEINTLLNNQFNDRKTRSLILNGLEIKTIFSDFEAFSICLGAENKSMKKIAKVYFDGISTSQNKIEAHKFAMAALEKYGSDFLSYAISLPPLTFKNINVEKIFSEMENKRKITKNPMIRITYFNEVNKVKEKLSLSFFKEKIDNELKFDTNRIILKNKYRNQQILEITKKGELNIKDSSFQIIPVLSLFISFSENPKKYIINYGLETGECSICGRELSDYESVKRGIGPICSQGILALQ